ncbi:MAG: SRPBCC family protein [Deltaproteobacteria bacterium]|nr:SRPBCC family protein [Deltaproteobacteria bacterium]
MLEYLKVKVSRRRLLASAALSPLASSSVAQGQQVAAPSAALQPLDPAVRAALQSHARGGAVVLWPDLDAGANGTCTVLTHVPAPIAQVRAIIASPEHYPEFIGIVRDVRVDSRRGPFTGFQFRASAGIFDIRTLASLRSVGARRVDIAIVQSDLGPGAMRWDLYEDQGGTLVSCTSRGDPSQGHWLLRQIAGRARSSITIMTGAVAILFSLALVRRASARGVVSPIPAVPVQALADLQTHVPVGGALASVRLNARGEITDVGALLVTTGTVDQAAGWLNEPLRYGQVFRSFRNVQIVSQDPRGTQFSASIETVMGRTSGTRLLTTRRENGTYHARWEGTAGDELQHHLEWRVSAVDPQRVAIAAFVGDEVNRIGFPLRGTLERELGLRAGLSVGLAIIWARALVNRLARDRETPAVVGIRPAA